MLPLILILLPWLVFPSQENLPADTTAVFAEKRIALSFSGSDSFIPEESQLNLAHSTGIDLLEISEVTLFENVQADSFSILLNTPIHFPTSFELAATKTEIVSTIHRHYREAQELFPDRIIAVNTFNFPAETKPDFSQLSADIADSLFSVINTPLYFRSAYNQPPVLPAGFSFTSGYITPATIDAGISTPVVHFLPSENSRQSLEALEELFSQTESFSESIIIIPAEWLFNRIEQQPELEYVFSSYIAGNPIPFPLPAETPPRPITNWSVVLLFFIWASFVIHFRYQPVYTHSLSRYFLNHTFFVKDVMEHRIRNATPGLILYAQHALLTGLFLYVSSEVLVSNIGLAALSHHFSNFLIEGHELISLFFLGVFTALVLQTVSILWIYAFNKKLRFFSQVLNLYCWPFHLNLVVVTFLVVFNLQGSADVWVLSLSLVFGIIWFLSFNIAAIDSARFLDKFKVTNILVTVGFHILLVSFFIWLFLNSPDIIEPLQLAISLP
ncbi:MAG: hypothetical protein WD604_05490 [Balneolaceae bacterium]